MRIYERIILINNGLKINRDLNKILSFKSINFHINNI